MPKNYRDSDLPLGGELYAGGTYSEGGTYMLVNTVLILRAEISFGMLRSQFYKEPRTASSRVYRISN